MNVLISTIVRNRIRTLPLWRDQIIELVRLNPDIEFHLSVAENDSTDGSKQFLKNSDFFMFKSVHLQEETLRTQQYGSVKDATRVKQLATARNKTLDCQAFKLADKVAVIEPDIRYNPGEMRTLLLSNHDIISVRSTWKNVPLYDAWATRKTKEDKKWNQNITLENQIDVWSTFSCFCVYRADVMRKRSHIWRLE